MNAQGSLLPSIWLGEFSQYDSWLRERSAFVCLSSVADSIDDKVLSSRHPHHMAAWCASCLSIESMFINWTYGGIGPDGSVHPAWTETAVCVRCGLNSRMRALISRLNVMAIPAWAKVYTPEAVTAGFAHLRSRFSRIVGSEYLGCDHISGRAYDVVGHGQVVHQDLTKLSFDAGQFDLIITQDVFEHIPDYRKSFSECYRVLNSTGKLVFTIPFFPELQVTEIRAKFDVSGELTHLLPPEYHGNPVDTGGALCFQHFGWDILDDLREAGFSTASAHLYWGPWQGHLGLPFFVFSADV